MITRLVNIDNQEYTVKRPIVQTVIEDIKRDIFRDTSMLVYYIDNYQDSNFDTDIDTVNKKPQHDYLEVSSEFTTDEDVFLTNRILDSYVEPILLDTDVEFYAKPVVMKYQLDITIKYHSKSKNKLLKLLDMLKANQVRQHLYTEHLVYYYYTIPVPLLLLLKDIYYKKTGSNDYYKYIEDISTIPIDYIRSRTENYDVPIIREEQPVIGTWMTDNLITEEKPQYDNGYWVLELNYNVELQLLKGLSVIYPILVNNKSIDKRFLPKDRFLAVIKAGSSLRAAFDVVRNDIVKRLSLDLPAMVIPIYDEWVPNIKPPLSYKRVFQLLSQINQDAPQVIFNLEDMLKLIINPDIKDYIRSLYGTGRLTSVGQSLFYLEVFANNTPVELELVIDKDGNIVAPIPLDLTKTYRVILSITTDLSDINAMYLDNIDWYTDILNQFNLYYKTVGRSKMWTNLIASILTGDI